MKSGSWFAVIKGEDRSLVCPTKRILELVIWAMEELERAGHGRRNIWSMQHVQPLLAQAFWQSWWRLYQHDVQSGISKCQNVRKRDQLWRVGLGIRQVFLETNHHSSTPRFRLFLNPIYIFYTFLGMGPGMWQSISQEIDSASDIFRFALRSFCFRSHIGQVRIAK